MQSFAEAVNAPYSSFSYMSVSSTTNALSSIPDCRYKFCQSEKFASAPINSSKSKVVMVLSSFLSGFIGERDRRKMPVQSTVGKGAQRRDSGEEMHKRQRGNKSSWTLCVTG